MTSSSDRVLRGPAVSDRLYRVGVKFQGGNEALDPRPYSAKEAEQVYLGQIAQLREKHQVALEAAYRNGYNDGAAMARDDATGTINNLTQLNDALIDKITNARDTWFKTFERQVVDLVCRSLTQILGDRPPVEERVLQALRQAFAELSNEDSVTVHCHPGELDMLKKILTSNQTEFGGVQRLRVVPDELVGPNGCLLQTELGVIDARIETQLAILKSALMDTAPPDDQAISDAPVVTMGAGTTS